MHDSKASTCALLMLAMISLGVAQGASARPVSKSRPVTQKAAKTACAYAHGLTTARLLTEARGAYRRLHDAKVDDPCHPAAKLAWIAGRQRHRARALERAREYRRVAQIQRTHGLLGGRSTALRRAQAAYIEALEIDPFSPGARRALRSMIAQILGPTHQASANLRCEGATRLLNAGLLPEAGLVLVKALRTGRTTRCIANLRRLRAQRAQAADALHNARAAERNGRKAAARALYVKALSADSSLTPAERALRALPRPVLSRSPSLPQRVGDRVMNVLSTFESVVLWIKDHWLTLIVVLVAAILLWIPLSTFLARRIQPGSAWSDRCDRFKPLRGFGEPTVGVVPATGGDDDATNARLTGLLKRGLAEGTVPEEARSGSARRLSEAPTDIALAVESLEPSGELLKAIESLSQGATVASVIRWTSRKVGRHRTVVRPEVIDGGPRGTGLVLTVTDWKGGLQRQEFWPLVADGNGRNMLEDVATQAAEWARTVAGARATA